MKNKLLNNFIMDHLTEEELIKIVKDNPYALEYINNQTEKICLEAVKQNGRALYYVKNQTDEICLEAVKQNGDALQYVNERTNEICLEAVKKEGCSLFYVKNQTVSICLEAVKQNGNVLQNVKKQNALICLEAIKQNVNALRFVKIKISIHDLMMINPYIIYYLKKCDKETYITVFRCLLNIKNKKFQRIDKWHIKPIHTIGYYLQKCDTGESLIFIFIKFLMNKKLYDVLKTIRMEQPFYNDIKK